MAVGVAVGLTLGIIVGKKPPDQYLSFQVMDSLIFIISTSFLLPGLIVGLTFGIIFGFIAGEVTNGKAENGQPKKTKREKEDEEWLAWIMHAQAAQAAQSQPGP